MYSLSDAELDALVAEAVVDCHDEYEQLSGLFVMIEGDLAVPFETEVLGVPVVVRKVDLRSSGIVAICHRGRLRQAIGVLDLPLPDPAPDGAQWIEAYQWWAGGPVSEYQYYEFVALDQALTAKQQGELRAVSSRGRITSSGFVNDYQWGDLKADPAKWMERYFDAHLYLANWGSRRIMLRLPKAALAPETAATFCVGESAGCWTTRTHVILDLRSEDEDGDEEFWDEEGQLAAIVPVRAELAGGDRRLLYLAWLLCVQNRELDDDVPEPPVPAGLAKLSGPLQALADFLRLDPDLLDAAAAASRPLAEKKPSVAELRRWVAGLPVADKDEMLLRVLRGDAGLLRSELLRAFHGVTEEPSAGERRTAGDLLAAAEDRWAARQQQIRAREVAERQRREEAAAAAREQRLDKLARNPVRAWDQVDELIATKRPKDYDAAVTLLLDLQALAVREGEIFEFAEQMMRLRERHARKPSLIDRFDRARLD